MEGMGLNKTGALILLYEIQLNKYKNILLKNKNNETCTIPMVGMGLNKTGAAGQFAR